MQGTDRRGDPAVCFATRCCRTARVLTPSCRNCEILRLIVPELPGFWRQGGERRDCRVADRMAEVVKDAARGEGPSCSATAMAASSRCRWRSVILASPRNSSYAGIAARRFQSPAAKPSATWRRPSEAKGLAAITDVAMAHCSRRNFRLAHPELMADRREAFLRTDAEVFRAACDALAGLDLRPELGKGKGTRAGAGRRT